MARGPSAQAWPGVTLQAQAPLVLVVWLGQQRRQWLPARAPALLTGPLPPASLQALLGLAPSLVREWSRLPPLQAQACRLQQQLAGVLLPCSSKAPGLCRLAAQGRT